MSKKKQEIKLDRLFEIFCGELVTIMLDRDLEETTQTETHIETLKTSISIQGFLVEMDDDFLFLGITPDMITQAVYKTHVVHIEILDLDIDEIPIVSRNQKLQGGMN